MVIRVNKTKDYSVMSNYHFKEKEMSLKAKGLLSLMLSLPNDWDYSIQGLTTLSKDGKDSIVSALQELEQFNYLKRTKKFNEKGQFDGYNYDIYEKPYPENPNTEKPYAENPYTENPTQLNTNKLNTNKYNIYHKKKYDVPEWLNKQIEEEELSEQEEQELENIVNSF